MIATSLVAVALSALSASAFHPPAFCVGRVTAARAKTTFVAYVDSNNSNEERISERDNQLNELKAKNLDLQFGRLSDKIDHIGRKIDDVKTGLDHKIDDIAEDVKTLSKDHDRKIDDVNHKIDDVKTGLVVIACLCLAPQLSEILAVFK
jgi:peptidoglycan hydrolase CwlO-like protein